MIDRKFLNLGCNVIGRRRRHFTLNVDNLDEVTLFIHELDRYLDSLRRFFNLSLLSRFGSGS